jgi:hypothetical protein
VVVVEEVMVEKGSSPHCAPSGTAGKWEGHYVARSIGALAAGQDVAGVHRGAAVGLHHHGAPQQARHVKSEQFCNF